MSSVFLGFTGFFTVFGAGIAMLATEGDVHVRTVLKSRHPVTLTAKLAFGLGGSGVIGTLCVEVFKHLG